MAGKTKYIAVLLVIRSGACSTPRSQLLRRPSEQTAAAASFVMVALCNRETIYIFMLFLSSSFFFFFLRLISAVGDWMFTILWHMVWP